ncbi:MAG: signal peptide peptidase SppA [Thermoanaerobaculia bacterium]|nr:signal peptide peptidase SppA [Thermoanaerobaculia bacterium]
MHSDQKKNRGCLGLVSFVYGLFDGFRRFVFNVVFYVLLFLFIGVLAGGDGVMVPEQAALVVAPSGFLVEELTGDPLERAVDELLDQAVPETRMEDLLDAIAAAKDDSRIQALYLDFDGLAGGGLDKLERFARAVEDFKESGKPIVAGGDWLSKHGYYLAVHADEVYLHDEGTVWLDGYGLFRQYHRDLIDRLEIDWNIFRPEVNVFKSAVEPYLRNDMSEDAKTASLAVLDDLWDGYLEKVAPLRNQTPEQFRQAIAELPRHMEEQGGDMAQVPLALGWVDHVGPRDLVRDRMIELVGRDEENHTFQQISMGDYLDALADDRFRNPQSGDGVGVVYAVGTILDGTQSPGTIGGDSTARLVRQARYDDEVKAIVLRVDSGGGSVFGSEVIRRELELARADGKPIVVSMGSVAASGGYWISTPSDRILASPHTITGSIGIFGMWPTFEDPIAEHLGTHTDGVGTTWLSGDLRIDRELDPQLGELIHSNIDHGYRQFLSVVAAARGMEVESVDEVARGRIWSGQDALDLGLVDQLGDLEEAVGVAAELAGLGAGHSVKRIERQLDDWDQLLVDMMEASVLRVAALSGDTDWRGRAQRLDQRLLRAVEERVEFLQQFNDPRGVYAHCLCSVE